jgi:hypothetical protein
MILLNEDDIGDASYVLLLMMIHHFRKVDDVVLVM